MGAARTRRDGRGGASAPGVVVEQLADVWSALSVLGHDLAPAEWARPTDCPGWSVADHFAHVIGTESVLAGRPPPPPPTGMPAHVRNRLGEGNEAWVAARRSVAADDLLAELDDVLAVRLAALAAMSDEELAVVGPSPIGEVAYSTFMGVRVMDCWVHEQDVRSATDRPWRFDGPAASAAIDRLAGAFGYVVGKRAGAPEGAVVTIELRGPGGGTQSVAVSGGRAAEAVDAVATTFIALDVTTFVRLACGRWSPERALDGGLVDLGGDTTLGRAVVSNLGHMP